MYHATMYIYYTIIHTPTYYIQFEKLEKEVRAEEGVLTVYHISAFVCSRAITTMSNPWSSPTKKSRIEALNLKVAHQGQEYSFSHIAGN